MTRIPRTPLLAAALVLACPLALAHGGEAAHTHFSGFLQGLLHPWLGLDHLLALLALGLWSSVSARRAWVAPLAFANMLLLGALLALGGLVVAQVEPLVASTVLALGLLLATRARLPGLLAAALAGIFAVLHGMAHGADLARTASDGALVQTLLGVALGTLLLHLLGQALGQALRAHAAGWTRALGAAVALAGVALLGTVGWA